MVATGCRYSLLLCSLAGGPGGPAVPPGLHPPDLQRLMLKAFDVDALRRQLEEYGMVSMIGTVHVLQASWGLLYRSHYM